MGSAPGKRPSQVNRRTFVGLSGAAIVSSLADDGAAVAADRPVIRWGIVGTGSIANSMAGVIASVPSAELAAVSSRRLASADAFAVRHGADRSFDDWRTMAEWNGIDAVYVATPTGVREEIAVAAANAGRHVLAEKPFASVDSVRRIVAACEASGSGFMDGTHFGHHPRTAALRERIAGDLGGLRALDSMFQFPLNDRGNIRYNPDLEPMGAIGDVGWYNMRALAEYLPADTAVRSASAVLTRDSQTGAVVRGGGVLHFDDDSVGTFSCGFDAGAVGTLLRLTCPRGVITVDDFAANNADGSADYRLQRGGWDEAEEETVRTASELTSRQLMFENFAAMTTDDELKDASAAITLRTQGLLDRVFAAALASEADA